LGGEGYAGVEGEYGSNHGAVGLVGLYGEGNDGVNGLYGDDGVGLFQEGVGLFHDGVGLLHDGLLQDGLLPEDDDEGLLFPPDPPRPSLDSSSISDDRGTAISLLPSASDVMDVACPFTTTSSDATALTTAQRTVSMDEMNLV
jgi:hypothetical protein